MRLAEAEHCARRHRVDFSWVVPTIIRKLMVLCNQKGRARRSATPFCGCNLVRDEKPAPATVKLSVSIEVPPQLPEQRANSAHARKAQIRRSLIARASFPATSTEPDLYQVASPHPELGVFECSSLSARLRSISREGAHRVDTAIGVCAGCCGHALAIAGELAIARVSPGAPLQAIKVLLTRWDGF